MKDCLTTLYYDVCNLMNENARVVADAIEKTHTGLTADGIATLVGTIITGGIASIIAIRSFALSEKRNRKKDIIDMLDRLIMISIEYPKVENIEFISKWGNAEKDDECSRYDNYCCMIFNFIERLWFYAKKDKKVMNDIVYYREYIALHYKWWKINYNINQSGYPEGFPEFIDESKREYDEKHSSQEVTA